MGHLTQSEVDVEGVYKFSDNARHDLEALKKSGDNSDEVKKKIMILDAAVKQSNHNINLNRSGKPSYCDLKCTK